MAEKDLIEILSREHYRQIYLYVHKICPRKELVEDIVQDVFLIAQLKKDEIEDHENAVSWLYCTARFRMLQVVSKNLPLEDLSAYENSEQGRKDYEDEWIDTLDVYPEIGKYLQEEEIQLLIQHYEEGYGYSELAAPRQVSEASLRMKVQRIRRKLKKKFR